MNDNDATANRPPSTGGWVRVPWSILDQLPVITPHGAAVLLALYRHADEHGRCFPSVRRLARKSGMSVPTARKAIGILERLGIITVQRRVSESGDDDSHVYLLPLLGGKGDCPPTQGDCPQVGNDVAQGGKGDCPGVGNDVSTKKIHIKNDTPKNEPRKKRERAHTPPDSRLIFLIDEWNARTLGPAVRRDPPKDVLRNWALMLKDNDARYLVESEDAIVRLLDSIPRNGWATAQASWRITWLLTRNGSGEWKAAKLLRGEYAATTHPSQVTAANRCGPGVVHDPNAETRTPTHGTI